jgi:ribosome-associated heat shock protein Hsp15
MEPEKNVRIDKWLWAVRILKTRSIATDACKKSKVFINDISVKPSHIVKIGEVIAVKQPFITRTFKVLGMLEKRVSAKLAKDFVEETTPIEEFEKLMAIRNDPLAFREKGSGRPTKKDRRKIERLKKF